MSNDVEHTPAPWKVDGQVGGTYFVAGQVEDGRPNGEVIAKVAPTVASLEVPTEANARLIAAAPDLLKAGKRLFSNHNEYATCPAGLIREWAREHGNDLTEEVLDDILNDLEDAIAKAQSGQSA